MTNKINTFQIKIPEEWSQTIKIIGMKEGVTKHDWILKAIAEKLERDKAV